MRIKQMMSVLPILAVVACGSTAEKQSVLRIEALADSLWAQSEPLGEARGAESCCLRPSFCGTFSQPPIGPSMPR